MTFIDKYGLNSFQDFDCFIQKYGNVIDAKHQLLKGIRIDVVGASMIAKYNSIFSINDYKDTPYACHTDMQIVVDNVSVSNQFTQDEKNALIAHEIGHLHCSLCGCKCNGFIGETHADDFSCSLGLKFELRSALTKLLGIVQDPILKSEIAQRIGRL